MPRSGDVRVSWRGRELAAATLWSEGAGEASDYCCIHPQVAQAGPTDTLILRQTTLHFWKFSEKDAFINGER